MQKITTDTSAADLRPQPGSLAVFFRSLAVMTQSGVRLDRALKLLSEQGDDPRMSQVSKGMSRAVHVGAKVSAGMLLYPKAFSQLQLKMVQVGERTGALDRILERLSDYEERRRATELKFKSALTYPAFLFGLALVMLVLVPPYLFQGLFQVIEESGVEPPLITVMVIAVSNLIRSFWFWPLLGLLILGGGWTARRAWSRPDVRLRVHQALLRVPVLGRAFRVIGLTQFARALAFQLEVGVPPLHALQLAGEASSNPVMELQSEEIIRYLKAGLPLHEAMAQAPFLPGTFLQMIQVGEESGLVPLMLERISDIYDSELEHSLEMLTSMMEPLMLLVMGIVVGFVIVATLLPLMQVIQNL